MNQEIKNGLDPHAEILILNEVKETRAEVSTMTKGLLDVENAIINQTKVIQNHVLTAKDLNAFLLKLVAAFVAIIIAITGALRFLHV